MDLYDPNDAFFFYADDVDEIGDVLDRGATLLPDAPPLTLVDPRTGREVPIPAPLAKAFAQVTRFMRFERTVMTAPIETSAPMEEIADELGIEIELLADAVGSGEIPSDVDESGRRIVRVVEVMRWRNREAVKNARIMDAMTERHIRLWRDAEDE